MPTVEVSFSPLPSHVRTARLVALAVARRAGVADDQLDEVRLAVGEACSRAVGVHAAVDSDEPVTMSLSDDPGRFTVEVRDLGTLDTAVAEDGLDPAELQTPTADENADLGAESLPAEFGLAVISGLVEDVEVGSDGNGTQVRMAWAAVSPPPPGAS